MMKKRWVWTLLLAGVVGWLGVETYRYQATVAKMEAALEQQDRINLQVALSRQHARLAGAERPAAPLPAQAPAPKPARAVTSL